MSPEEIAAHVDGTVILVRIGTRNLNDPSRGRIDPGNPSTAAVADRLRQWWRLKSWVECWQSHAKTPPAALVGISGEKHRYVIGAMDLRNFDWNQLGWCGSDASFPMPKAPSLDAFELRGRTVVKGAVFSRFSEDLVRVYSATGQVPLR